MKCSSKISTTPEDSTPHQVEMEAHTKKINKSNIVDINITKEKQEENISADKILIEAIKEVDKED
jgi:hypothetical protein